MSFHPNVYKVQALIRGLRENGPDILPEQAIITPEDYTELARVTRSKVVFTADAKPNAAMGLTGEAGEVADCIKKELFHGHDRDPDHIEEELGDLLWYASWVADLYGLTLTGCMQRNIRKLRARYPEGFTEEASRGRES